MKKYICGLIVGKFSPLHVGHVDLITTAINLCEKTIILSYSVPEMPGCEAEKRQRWLKSQFPNSIVVILDAEKSIALGLGPLPANDAHEDLHRHFVADVCLDLLQLQPDAVFTAEDYGDGFAQILTQRFEHHVAHVRLRRDPGPCAPSGTLIRSDVHRWRHYLPPRVYSDFVRRICLLGGESTGKSSLSKALADTLQGGYVAEYGRERWETVGGSLEYEDLLHIAETQVLREECENQYAWLVCDTSPLTTLFYSLYLFGRAEEKLYELARRPYDIVVLCSADIPFIQDGTRQDEAFRQLQQEWYERELRYRGITFLSVSGTIAQRIEQILLVL